MADPTELQRLIEQRNTLDKRIRELEQTQSAEASPFKIGQTITWKHGNGRRRGVVVNFIGVSGDVIVRIVLKNGGNGRTKRVYLSWDKPEAEEVSHG
jgi:ribosomal protein L35AE/L33A